MAAAHVETMTAADLAATVRGALEKLRLAGRTSSVLKTWCDDAIVALDTLQAQAEAAQREADIQMGAKLAAQMTLKAVCDVLNLPMVSLGNGWTEATPKIIARIEEIVDEADRAFRERDEAIQAIDSPEVVPEDQPDKAPRKPAATSSEGQGNQQQSHPLTSGPDLAAPLPDPEVSNPAKGQL